MRGKSVRSSWPVWMLSVVTVFAVAAPVAAWSGAFRHGVRMPPRQTAESEEVALALTAAPSALTDGADVYAWQNGHYIKARTGTSGAACIVSRDERVDGVFPMCFNAEGARTLMPDEMMQSALRSRRLSDSAIQRQVDAAYAAGTLHHPDKPALTFMMSSHQMLTTASPEGRKLVGPWRPHVMIYLPHTTAADLGLGAENDLGPVSAPFGDAGGTQLIVEVPHWADSPAAPDVSAGGGN